ncbi:hypothetical protein [Abiotrophia defectiva]|jgi:hypothetical protein|uniref:hypothetical protein n=1 Tax=Abiotrophia defectiva TaxID=46125 RepID=UPI0028D02735|nr:hypothetical protein [Abiotrophia defectiva]
MKQFFKKMAALVMALTLIFVSLPKVQAEDLAISELLGRSYEAYRGLKSFHTQGTLKAAIDRQTQHMDLGQVEVDGYVDIPNLNGELKLVIDSIFLPQFRQVRWGIKDNQAFYQLDDEYAQVEDASEQKADLKKSIEREGFNFPAKDEVVKALAQHDDLIKQIFKLTETDSEYVLSLRDDIDAKKLFDDNKAALDQFKQEIYEEMEARGEKVSPSYKAQIERFYSAETLSKFLESKPVYEVHFAKDSYLVTSYKMEVTLRFTDFLDSKEVEKLGLYTFYYNVEMSFDGFNESREITVPEEKLPSLESDSSRLPELSQDSESSSASE